MKKITLLIILIGLITFTNAQQSKIDSLQRLIADTKTDTGKIALLDLLSFAYRDNQKVDSCIIARKQALALNKKTNYSLRLECYENAGIAYMLYETGNYTESLEYAVENLALIERLNDTFQRGSVHLVFGHNYRALGEFRQSLNHYFKAKDFFYLYWTLRNRPEDNTYTKLCISQTYLKMNTLDSALIYVQQAYNEAIALADGPYILLSTRIFGDIYLTKGDDDSALHYYRQYIPAFTKYKEINRDLGFVLINMARIFQKRNQIDSAFSYASNGLANALKYNDLENIYKGSLLLSDYYKGKNDREAFDYLKIAVRAKDSMISIDKSRQVQMLLFNDQVREKEIAAAEAKDAATMRQFIIAAAILVSIVSFLMWNRIRQLGLKHKMILEQKESEKLKAKYEKELMEIESRALRAQMNPHFIFNCLNSIKALIQENENEKGVVYLTTFSKLIRTLFNNADKKEITLYDEIETCRLYLQLEAMRFANKLSYTVVIDDTVDLKSIDVPALIIQPFIENAIWHGIVPKEERGSVQLAVMKENGAITIVVEDDGIGRVASQQNKPASGFTHQSKGINLTQSRLELDNLLQQRKAKLEIIDKKDEKGITTGTVVVITLTEET